jgi:hypothetical protein
MKFTLKNFLLFTALYIFIIFVINFFISFLYNYFGWQLYPPIPGGGYSYLKLPFPTVGEYHAALPPEMLSEFDLKVNYLGIILDILLLISSIYLVFIKKIKLYFWGILFTMFNLLTITYLFLSEITR